MAGGLWSNNALDGACEGQLKALLSAGLIQINFHRKVIKLPIYNNREKNDGDIGFACSTNVLFLKTNRRERLSEWDWYILSESTA